MEPKSNHKYFLNESEMPVPIPPLHDAWKNMHKKLEEEIPETVIAGRQSLPKNKKRLKRISLILLLLLITLVTIKQVYNKPGQRTLVNTAVNNSKTFKHKELSPLSSETKNTVPKSEAGKRIKSQDKFIPDNNVNANTKKANKERGKNNLLYYRSISLYEKSYKKTVSKRKSTSGKYQAANLEEIGNHNQTPIDASYNWLESLNNAKNIIKDIVNDSANTISSINKTDLKSIKDGIQNTGTDKEDVSGIMTLKGGIQWNIQIPTSGTGNYLIGPKANNQPYALLPGAWLNLQVDKSLVVFEINPFFNNLVPARPFGTYKTFKSIFDTIITTTETRTLKKLFGISAGIIYAYNISNKLWLGGGFQGYWWQNGVVTAKGEEERQVINSSSKITSAFTKTYPITDEERTHFLKFQIVTAAELLYQEKNGWDPFA